MTRTAIVAFPITLFLAWFIYVVGRSGSGQGLKWHRVPDHVYFVVAVVGTAYLIFFLILLLVTYFTRIRGESVTALSVILPMFLRFAGVFVAAIALGSALGETFVLADERAFRAEAVEYFAKVKREPNANHFPLYGRQRWWPGSTNGMSSDPPN